MAGQNPRHPPQGVPAQFALTLLQEVAAIGRDPAGLLASLGLPFTQGDLVAGRMQVISDHHFVQLYGECITVPPLR